MPGLEFTCSGIITSYSALTVVHTCFEFLQKEITFSVWRPKGQGVHTVVGRNQLLFGGGKVAANSFDINSSIQDRKYFKFIDRTPPDGHISFQAGDIVGWQVYHEFKGVVRPLSMVYREATNPEKGFDFLSTLTSFVPPCALSECDEGIDTNTTRLSGLIPY